MTDEKCEKCGRPMILKKGRFGNFLACSGYPKCRSTKALTTGVPCPRDGCDGEIVERVSKRGIRFYGCNRFPQCKTLFRDKPVKRTCPACGALVMLEKYTKKGGVKWACANRSCGYSVKPDSEENADFQEGTM
jgi:DNA topoisomerase-1